MSHIHKCTVLIVLLGITVAPAAAFFAPRPVVLEGLLRVQNAFGEIITVGKECPVIAFDGPLAPAAKELSGHVVRLSGFWSHSLRFYVTRLRLADTPDGSVALTGKVEKVDGSIISVGDQRLSPLGPFGPCLTKCQGLVVTVTVNETAAGTVPCSVEIPFPKNYPWNKR